MKWTEFLMILLGIYFAYYGLNLAFDLLNAGERLEVKQPDDGVLHFTEDEPELIIPAKQAPASSVAELPAAGAATASEPFAPGDLLSGGAASLKQLFELAKDDLIEYTKAISY